MCTEEFIRMMFTVDLYGNRGLDARSVLVMGCVISLQLKKKDQQKTDNVFPRLDAERL